MQTALLSWLDFKSQKHSDDSMKGSDDSKEPSTKDLVAVNHELERL